MNPLFERNDEHPPPLPLQKESSSTQGRDGPRTAPSGASTDSTAQSVQRFQPNVDCAWIVREAAGEISFGFRHRPAGDRRVGEDERKVVAGKTN